MDKTVFLIILISGLNTLTSCITHQYHLVNMNKTWTEAQSYCREIYTDLASISDSEDYDSLLTLLSYTNSDYGEAWIGLRFGRWMWSLVGNETEGISNGWPAGYPWLQSGLFSYSYWQKTCVIMTSNGMWSVNNCDAYNYFVCFDGRLNATQTFVIITNNMTWNQAQSYCRENYTDLAVVRNQTENQVIQNLLPRLRIARSVIVNISVIVSQGNYNFYPVWIGLYRDGSWSDGSNSSLNINAGYNEEPGVIGLNESCVTVQTSQYFYESFGRNCNITLPFVCYSELCSISLNTSHQYHLVNMNKNWTEAQSYCRETYTDLATVSDTEDYDSLTCLINSTLGSSGRAWIGLKFNWRWSLENNETEGISSGWPGGYPWYQNVYMYNNWHFCVLMDTFNGQWQGFYCEINIYFVCYDGRQNATQTFVLVQEGKTWYQAQSYCRDNYTDLAIVRNQAENQAIRNLTQNINTYSVYLGNQGVNQSLVNNTQTNYFYPVWIGLYSNESWLYLINRHILCNLAHHNMNLFFPIAPELTRTSLGVKFLTRTLLPESRGSADTVVASAPVGELWQAIAKDHGIPASDWASTACIIAPMESDESSSVYSGIVPSETVVSLDNASASIFSFPVDNEW
ncbi:hypothetical protein DPEC_G00230290 [Dallia pectoralis]|uniref:Uncharacterized protein n=1 Tax=Dallia pectoralis TaxID=75939 RepID=A0ACC2G1Z1_DALPE|nr:hypothetical protein DPEC_G00230290 [Dallia pectoralis]